MSDAPDPALNIVKTEWDGSRWISWEDHMEALATVAARLSPEPQIDVRFEGPSADSILRDWRIAIERAANPKATNGAPPEFDLDARSELTGLDGDTVVRAVIVGAAIERLREDEGDSVEILCDNPDFGPNNAVVCCGWWTTWGDRRFEGDTLSAALQAAVKARDEYFADADHG